MKQRSILQWSSWEAIGSVLASASVTKAKRLLTREEQVRVQSFARPCKSALESVDSVTCGNAGCSTHFKLTCFTYRWILEILLLYCVVFMFLNMFANHCSTHSEVCLFVFSVFLTSISISCFLFNHISFLLWSSLICVFSSASPLEVSLVSMFGYISVSLFMSLISTVKLMCLSLGLSVYFLLYFGSPSSHVLCLSPPPG